MNSVGLRGGRSGGSSPPSAEETEAMLDSQNRELSDQLTHKVSRLKNLALDIESETKDHNRLLDGLDGDMESGSTLLGGNMNRLHALLGTGRSNRKLSCYVSAIMVATFIFSYYLIGYFRQ